MNQIAPINGAGSARLPASYESAKQALSACVSIDECKDWADKAAALASYAKQAEDLELERMAARIRARAMRRAGELLKQIEPATGQNNQYAQVKKEGAHPLHSRQQVASDAGMSSHQAKQAVRIASIPEPEFTAQVESRIPPTLTGLAQQGTQKREAPDPQIWLKGRNPEAFNKALHFVAMVTEYAAELGKSNLELILPNLDEKQASTVRQRIAAIDSVHDIIVTRI